MSYDPNVLRRANQVLAERRRVREEDQQRRQAEIYTKLPRVAQIDRQLRQTAAQVIQAALCRGEDPVPAIAKIREKNLSLQAERSELLAQSGRLDFDSLRSMAELVEGSFVFTVLDDRNNLYFVKGDNPLCLIQLPHLGLYLYASTKAILWAALDRLGLKKERLTELPVDEGEIITLSPDGARHSDYFDYTGHWSYGWFSGFNGSYRRSSALSAYDDSYLQQLKNIAASLGHTGEEIDALLADGFSTDELEELLYHYGVCY